MEKKEFSDYLRIGGSLLCLCDWTWSVPPKPFPKECFGCSAYYGYAPEDMEEQDNAVDIAQQSKDSASAVAETETEKESETETEEEIKRQK